jgi:hypothetical protein
MAVHAPAPATVPQGSGSGSGPYSDEWDQSNGIHGGYDIGALEKR